MFFVHYKPLSGTRADYDTIMRNLAVKGKLPAPGNVLHVAYNTEGTAFEAVEVWESEELWRDYLETLLTEVRAVGTDIGTPQRWEVRLAFVSPDAPSAPTGILGESELFPATPEPPVAN